MSSAGLPKVRVRDGEKKGVERQKQEERELGGCGGKGSICLPFGADF